MTTDGEEVDGDKICIYKNFNPKVVASGRTTVPASGIVNIFPILEGSDIADTVHGVVPV
jgi:hypothetical protein